VPDILEGKVEPGQHASSVVVQGIARFVVNGREYTDWNQVPESDRRAMEAAGFKPDQLLAQPLIGRANQLNPPANPATGGITLRISWGAILTFCLALAAAAYVFSKLSRH